MIDVNNNIEGLETRKIAFIIVAYKEIFHTTICYKTLINSIDAIQFKDYFIFIYDNTDDVNWNIKYDNKLNKDKLYYYHDSQNSGLSVAYNRMAIEAEKHHVNWIILFDQDTTLPRNAVSEYIKGMNKHPNIALKVPILYIGDRIFSPMKFRFMRSIPLKKPLKQIYNLSQYAFVNSGLMVNLAFYKKIGGYNEKIKLDFADFQFIEKSKKHISYFEVLPIHCQQNFSHFEHTKEAALKRYSIYIRDWAQCEKRTFKAVSAYIFVGLLHLIKLTIKYKTGKFIKLTLKYIKIKL